MRTTQTESDKQTKQMTMTRTLGRTDNRQTDRQTDRQKNTRDINMVRKKSALTPLESDEGDPRLLKVIDLRPESDSSRVRRPRIVLRQRVLGLPQL